MKPTRVNMIANKRYLTSILAIAYTGIIWAQSDWKAPESTKENISIHEFDDDKVNEGSSIYENFCISCHGTPELGNYTLMVPAPGDPAENKFQDQTDGELFYKIKKGRVSMPAFEDALSEDELWGLIAYIRSYNKDYVQPKPDLQGVIIPEYQITLSIDNNIDNLVVKVFENGTPVENASTSAFIQGLFGKYSLGKSNTNALGISYFYIDPKIPGDSLGNLLIIAKASKGYGSVNITEQIKAGKPSIKKSAIEGRHLWSTSKNAPVWLKVCFYLVGIGIWGTIFYIIFGLRKLKNV